MWENFTRKTREERWWRKGDCEEDRECKVGWEKQRVKAQDWLWVLLPRILTSYALSPQSAHLSLHCLTFPLNNVGTEAIPFFSAG